MSSMTYQATPRFSQRQHHQITTATFVVLFWAVAALAVCGTHRVLDAASWQTSFAVKVGAIVVAGYAYIRFTARDATLHHGLGVGVMWLLFAIIAEVAIGAAGGTQWTVLLGAPSRPFLRNVMLFIWITAPALFARRRYE